MSLPSPQPGLVVSYEFLWADEADAGRETGRKGRPCVIVLAVEDRAGQKVVTVAPITHSPPRSPEEAIEMPAVLKRRLALDDGRSWVVLTELNQFIWPGHDLQRRAGGGEFYYGAVPPNFLTRIVAGITAVWRSQGGRLVSRE